MHTTGRRAHQLWRALTYLSAAQLYLRDNPTGTRPLHASDLKPHPAGHWGTAPCVAWVLAGLATQPTPVMPIVGPGHAGVVQRAYGWLTADLAAVRPRYARSLDGLRALCAEFPSCAGLGSEVHPELPAGCYVGGQLGPALAVAQAAAAAQGDTGPVLVPIVGDGEAETGDTAAAWLADPVIRPDPARAPLLPILNLNGLRMGSASLLASRSRRDIETYLAGAGWSTRWAHIADASLNDAHQFVLLLQQALAAARDGERVVLVLDMPKGISGPAAGTPACHKTPLTDPAGESHQRSLLRRWLASYRPTELFTDTGAPATALLRPPFPTWSSASPDHVSRSPATTVAPAPRGASIEAVLRAHAPRGLHVFCPDELASNRLGGLVGQSWTCELLNEPVCAAWLLGHTTAGAPGLLVTYEAFAPLITTMLVQHAKTLRLRPDRVRYPSVNVLVTSLGWHNCYTHGDPGLATTLLALADPAIRIYTPADAGRAAAQLDRMLTDTGTINVLIRDKHLTQPGPTATVEHELEHGWAVWHEPDQAPRAVVISIGDIAAHHLARACRQLVAPIRHIHVHEPTVLGDPDVWPHSLSPQQWRLLMPPGVPLLAATIGHPAAVWGLLGPRAPHRLIVRGWQEPARPMEPPELLRAAGLDTDSLATTLGALLAQPGGESPC